MKTHIYSIKKLFGEFSQWVIPIYQRRYVWMSKNDKQIPGMWDDWKFQTEKLLRGEKSRPHYFGAIICWGKDKKAGEMQKMDLVDGQQRLTTFQLAFAALRDTGKHLGYKKADDINNCIFNMFNKVNKTKEPELDKYKLYPSKLDRELFQEIVARDTNSPKDKSELTEAYLCFRKSIELFIKEKIEESEEAEEEIIKTLIETLKKALLEAFQVVIITLDKDDDAQQIFESLNGQAEPLSPFDLIRNDIFYRARGADGKIEIAFEKQWDYFEDKFWVSKQRQGNITKPNVDHFIIAAVIAQAARDVNHRRIFAEYQKYIRESHFGSVYDELNALKKYGESYKLLQKPLNANSARIAKFLKLWDLTTLNPLVLWIDTRNNKQLSLNDKQTLFRMIENYIIRRHICKLASKSFDKNVVSVLSRLHKAETQGESIIGAFKEFFTNAVGESVKMPTDSEILDACEKVSIYGDNRNKSTKVANKFKYILGNIEQHICTNNKDVTINTGDLNIEHIMPQKWSKNWSLNDGIKVTREEWWDAYDENPNIDNSLRPLMEKRQDIIHTIGNLTLVTSAFNSALSDSAWDAKKEMIEEESALKLNRDIAKKTEWNEDAIKTRSEELARHINEIWPHPQT